MVGEALVCDGLVRAFRMLEELLEDLILRDEVSLQTSTEGITIFLLPAEGIQCWQS